MPLLSTELSLVTSQFRRMYTGVAKSSYSHKGKGKVAYTIVYQASSQGGPGGRPPGLVKFDSVPPLKI